MKKTAVVLLGFGGPDSLDAVGPFMEKLTGRKPPDEVLSRVKEKYMAIGGRSPLLDMTLGQADELRSSLAGEGDFGISVAMCYWKPFIGDVFEELYEKGYRKYIAFPMAPFRTKISTDAYLRDVNAFSGGRSDVEVTFVSQWHEDRLFIEANAENIEKCIGGFDREAMKIIFSVHNIPVSHQSEIYFEQVKSCSQSVINRIGNFDCIIAFQSKGGGPGPWLEPELIDEMDIISRVGYKSVLVVPIGFTCDHVETLYDLDIEAKNYAESIGLNFLRAPSLNNNTKFIEMMKKVILETNQRMEGE